MKKMRHSSHGLRIALLAGASVVALAAAAPSAEAADLNKPMPMKARAPVPVPKETWTWWIEGGAFHTDGGSLGLAPGLKPDWGGEGAIGFDWQPFAPMHVVGQFRYGAASKSALANPQTFISGPTTISLSNANQNLREDHWLIDFGIGRDFGLGNSNATWTLGVRVADLRATLNLNAHTSETVTGSPAGAGVVAAQQRSTFVGAGPRFGVQGDVPLGGQWSIDWLAGAAVLFGERNTVVNFTNVFTPGVGATVTTPFAVNSSDSPAVFNVDAQAGLSYWFNPNLKFTVSYRYDEYFKALKTIQVTTITTAGPQFTSSTIDRSYSGPMVRLTWKY
jgi:Legionella pneumophila major outer membrane protein precursor